MRVLRVFWIVWSIVCAVLAVLAAIYGGAWPHVITLAGCSAVSIAFARAVRRG